MTEVLQKLGAGLSEILVYGAIALVTLVGVCKCIYPVFRNASLLNRAVIKLEKSAANNERPIWREARFLGRALRSEWQKFLLNAGQLDMRGMPCDTKEYINEDTVIYKPGHAQLAELLPSLLTSLGILGTFLGLMEGLTSMDFSNAAGTIESIPTLLNGMRFAFATSVAGIACSLCFNMINRIAVGHAFKTLDAFDEAFYELAMPRPLDADVQMLCQHQDDEANLQRAADRVSATIANSVEIAVSRAIHPLTMSMDNFIQGTSREQVEGIKRIVGQFVQQMNTSLNGQFTALAETMTLVSQGQMSTQENLQRTLKVSEQLASDARRIQQASNEIATRMEQDGLALNDAQKDELLSLLRETLQRQTELTECVKSTEENLASGLLRLEERVARMEDTTELQPLNDNTFTEEG